MLRHTSAHCTSKTWVGPQSGVMPSFANSQAAPLLDNIVFSAIKKGFGGRLRFVVSGGAPLGSSVQEFLQIVLCCPILQGYGLTETCGPAIPRDLHAATTKYCELTGETPLCSSAHVSLCHNLLLL